VPVNYVDVTGMTRLSLTRSLAIHQAGVHVAEDEQAEVDELVEEDIVGIVAEEATVRSPLPWFTSRNYWPTQQQ